MDRSTALIPSPYANYRHQHGTAWESQHPFSEVELEVDPSLKPNEHRIEITSAKARISAGHTQSLAEGNSTFSQLMKLSGHHEARNERLKIAPISIHDFPRFAWRSLQLDLTKTVLTIEQLKTIVSALALYKINVVQLVLGSDDAWVMEIKGYPKLKSTYRQSELRQLAEFAKERGITLVPVVDLPTGTKPVVSAYPVLGVLDQQSQEQVLGAHTAAFQFVEDVLNQLTKVFPSTFVQVGNFNSDLKAWALNREVNKELSSLKLVREFEVLGHLMQICAETLASKNRRLILPSSTDLIRIPKDAVILVDNLDTALDLTARGYQIIVTRKWLNLSEQNRFLKPKSTKQFYLALATLMRQDELRPDALEHTYILGFMAHYSAEITALQLHQQLFPKIIAFAEQTWQGPKRQLSWGKFKSKLQAQTQILQNIGINI